MIRKILNLSIGVRLIGGIFLVIGMIVGGMTFWSVREQNRMAIEQAKTFGAGTAHVITSGVSALMLTGNNAQVQGFLEQIRKSEGIDSAKIIRGVLVSKQFGPGSGGSAQTDALEQRVLADGQPQFALESQGGKLVYRAVVPVIAKAGGASGNGCPSCHQVEAGNVMGAVSIGMGLDHLRQATSEFQRNILLGAGAVSLIFLWGFYVMATRTISRPLHQTVRTLKDIAQGEGDLTVRLAVTSKDEVGEVCLWFNTFIEKLEGIIRSIGRNTEGLAGSAEQLTGVSQQMSSNSEETAAQANVVSAASEQVSKNVQTVAAGAEEMGASIKEIAKSTNEAARVAKEAVEVAEKTNATIAKLGESSAEIGNVIKVITSIAEQTNLLALNATIEAARAGEAGKGFAVVANEVKELAKQTGDATEDISNKISAIQHDTEGAVAAIQQIGGIINQINDITNTIASAVEEQSVTTNEMSRNVTEAAKGSNEIVQNITGVAQAAQSTASGATETQAAAEDLARMASELQSLVSQFKYNESHQVKAAARVQGNLPKPPRVEPQATYLPASSNLQEL